MSVTDAVVARGGVAELLAIWSETLPPGTTVAVTADLVDTSGTTVETVTLHDDGSHQDRAAGDGLVEQWVGILAVPLEIQVPGLVVDPGAQVIDFLKGRSDPAGQHHGGALHRMA